MCELIKVDFGSRSVVSKDKIEGMPETLGMPAQLQKRMERDVRLFGHCNDPEVTNMAMDMVLSNLADCVEKTESKAD